MSVDVTVIIPIYNTPNEIIEQCIKSVVNQTIRNIEILIIDDGSQMVCAEYCDYISGLDKRIEVIHKENGGVSSCRNVGIEMASGEWLAFIDGDDWIEPDYLEELVFNGNKSGADIILCDCVIEYLHRSVENNFFCASGLSSDDCGKDRFLLQFLCGRIYNDSYGATDAGAPWAKIYRRKFILEKDLWFDVSLRRMQDNIFNLYAFEKAEKIIYFDSRLYHYRKSSASGFSKYNSTIIENYLAVFEIISKFIDENNKGDDFYRALDYKIIFSVYVILKTDLCNRNNEQGYKERCDKLHELLNNTFFQSAIKNVDTSLLNQPEKVLLFTMKIKSLLFMKILLNLKNVFFKIMRKET